MYPTLVKHNKFWAVMILAIMGVLMFLSAKEDTPNTDENLMIGVGDLILKEQYYKVGFEHPPLMRDIVALPLLFMDLKPASQFLLNQRGMNLSDFAFVFGEEFIYQQSTDPQSILMAARTPAILLTLAFGFFIFIFALNYFNLPTAYFSLAFFASSPFFLTHGRFTTLDVPMSLFSFLTLWALIKLLELQTIRSAINFGLVLASALLIKFPMASIVPFLIFIYVLHFCFSQGNFKKYLLNFTIPIFVSLSIIYLIYWFHIWNYPLVEHIADMKKNIFETRSFVALKMEWIVRMAEIDFLRPLAHYFYGLFWQLLRSGTFGYYFGEGAFHSWQSYYPFSFLAKNTEGFVILFFGSIAISLISCLRSVNQWFRECARARAEKKDSILKVGCRESCRAMVQKHLPSFTILAWALYYSYILIFVNSGNSGSRYIMPVLAPLFILMSSCLVSFIKIYSARWIKIVLAVLISLQFISVYRLHPSYLPYFSYFFGGPKAASDYIVDTDVDWGQDIKRLADWVNENHIDKITVANGFEYIPVGSTGQNLTPVPFFFSSNVYLYYLKEKMVHYTLNEPVHGWLAVPGRILAWGQARASQDDGWSSQTFKFLQGLEPQAIIGGSIWVYNLK